MVQEEQEPSAGRQDSGDLGEGGVDIGDVLEHEAGHGDIDRCRRDRQRGGRALEVGGPTGPIPTDRHLRPRRIDADDPEPGRGRDPGDLSLTRSHVEHRSHRRKVLRDQRDDLFGVLRVDTLGELVLPPLGVGLPGVRHQPSVPAGGATSRAFQWRRQRSS